MLLQIIAGLLRLTSVAAGLFSFDGLSDLAPQLYLLAIPVLLVLVLLVAALYGLSRALLAKRQSHDRS
jgi:hypothetical protein